ncbi:MAG: ABC transporter ATP-binding protein [Bacteroidetes bacterium]|nr:ABC transporter ATP-binding protein [Bacteroidota bacterium]
MESSKQNIILEAKNITKYFYDPVKVKVLNDISFAIKRSEFVSIIGKSGCGKSTLLYVLSTMDSDYEGDLFIDGENMRGRKEKFLANIRNEKIGFVFQFHYLLKEFNVLHNVMLPALKLNLKSKEAIELDALNKLDMLGIKNLAVKKPNQLSGGEKQRVAIARAMINDPLIIMCDEPTGNLDKKNSSIVFDIFKRLSTEQGQALLVVTHDPQFAEDTNRIIEMEDGRIIRQ